MKLISWDIVKHGWKPIKDYFKHHNKGNLVTRFKNGFEYIPTEKIYFVVRDRIRVGVFGFNINSYGNLTGCWILISNQFRDSGIGKKIKKFQDTYAKAIKAKRIYSVVNKDNKPCLKMLRRCGYFVYRVGRDCYFLCKSFDPHHEPTEVKL